MIARPRTEPAPAPKPCTARSSSRVVHVRRQRAADRGEDVDHRADEHARLAPDTVGQWPPHQLADGEAGEEDGDGQLRGGDRRTQIRRRGRDGRQVDVDGHRRHGHHGGDQRDEGARPGRDRTRQGQAHAPSGKRATTRNGATRWVCANRASWSIGTGSARWEARAACRMALTSSALRLAPAGRSGSCGTGTGRRHTDSPSAPDACAPPR